MENLTHKNIQQESSDRTDFSKKLADIINKRAQECPELNMSRTTQEKIIDGLLIALAGATVVATPFVSPVIGTVLVANVCALHLSSTLADVYNEKDEQEDLMESGFPTKLTKNRGLLHGYLRNKINPQYIKES